MTTSPYTLHKGRISTTSVDATPSPQVQRLAALARFQAARITRLERQLAEACRPRPRRRRVPDARQLVLTF
jgi:hypothetical protein